jgi:hypothetical protein
MDGHPWFYLVDYEADINAALQKLRQREFQAGRYNPVVWFPQFPVSAQSPSPGPQHKSIEKAVEASNEDGTRSILDMERVSDTPDYCAVARLPDETLIEWFGTNKPTDEMVENSDELFESLERGQGVYIVVYSNDQPSGIFFAGYSFD